MAFSVLDRYTPFFGLDGHADFAYLGCIFSRTMTRLCLSFYVQLPVSTFVQPADIAFSTALFATLYQAVVLPIHSYRRAAQ